MSSTMLQMYRALLDEGYNPRQAVEVLARRLDLDPASTGGSPGKAQKEEERATFADDAAGLFRQRQGAKKTSENASAADLGCVQRAP